MDTPDLFIDSLLVQYQRSLEAGNKSPKTISGYMDTLRRYSHFLNKNSLDKPVNELGRQELESYIRDLRKSTRWSNSMNDGKDRGSLSPVTIQDHARDIKTFWSWLFNYRYIETNALAKFSLPKVPETIIKTLTLEQIKSFLNVIDRLTSVGVRNYCVVLLMIDTGMRISEVVTILLADLDLNKCLVKIIGKGRKERTVSIHMSTRKELSKYMQHHRQYLYKLDSPYLFPASDGNHISIQSVQQAIRRIGQKARPSGIKYHAHLFRHTFATMFLANGGDVIVLKDILWHKSILTTQKYIHLLPEDLQRQHWRYSPIGDLFNK